MKKLYIDNKSIIEVKIANNMFSRMKGLMFVKNINYGILLSPCNSIHTFFMKEPIDVIYLDKYSNIVKIEENIKPWRLCNIVKKSKYVLELPYGTISQNYISIKSEIYFQ